jgi:alanine-glyoxylate transaminase / serine-glyoxylate transaminase / serine-pyruvate transaminase
MKAYEFGSAAYFATPPVNLIYAFHVSLKSITHGGISLEERFHLHCEASKRVKQAAFDLGLKQVRCLGLCFSFLLRKCAHDHTETGPA